MFHFYYSIYGFSKGKRGKFHKKPKKEPQKTKFLEIFIFFKKPLAQQI